MTMGLTIVINYGSVNHLVARPEFGRGTHDHDGRDLVSRSRGRWVFSDFRGGSVRRLSYVYEYVRLYVVVWREESLRRWRRVLSLTFRIQNPDPQMYTRTIRSTAASIAHPFDLLFALECTMSGTGM